MMCQTLGIRQAAQTEILMGWHNLQDRKYSELRPAKRVRRAVDKLLLRRATTKHGRRTRHWSGCLRRSGSRRWCR